jgi:hypothetical protein
MSQTYISAELRRVVLTRAQRLCEYCLLAEEDTFLGCALDHIISEKHGGLTESENLALACVFCNQSKGSDIGSIHWATNTFVRFFNPRIDRWRDHFTLVNNRIEPLSAIAETTERILGFNTTERLLERDALIALQRYPSSRAKALID